MGFGVFPPSTKVWGKKLWRSRENAQMQKSWAKMSPKRTKLRKRRNLARECVDADRKGKKEKEKEKKKKKRKKQSDPKAPVDPGEI
jgi:hypothetical protein